MMRTVPYFVKLARGLTQHTTELDASQPGTSYCENVDFSVDGEVCGRPGFVRHSGFGHRSFNSSTGTVVGDTGTTDAPQWDFLSLFKHRDGAGERAGLAGVGRVWTWEGDRWADRLYCGTARVTRVADLLTVPGTAVNTTIGTVNSAYNFTNFAPGSGLPGVPLLSSTGSVENYQPGGMPFGGSCVAVDTSTGDRYYCSVGNNGANNNLQLSFRKNHDNTITLFTLKTDCLAVTPVAPLDAPRCCSDISAFSAFSNTPTIWVVYRQTGGTNVNVMRVSILSGTVAAQQTFALANITGLSMSSDSAGNTVVVAFTQNATAGAALRAFNATSCVNNAGSNNQFNNGSLYTATGNVAIAYWFAGTCLVANTELPGAAGRVVVVGTYSVGAGTSVVKHILGDTDSTGLGDFSIAHQPINITGPSTSGFVGRKRIILGVNYRRQVTGLIYHVPDTWYALDFTDVARTVAGGETLVGGTIKPGLLAMGPVDTAFNHNYCHDAIPGPNGDSYRFASWEDKLFSSLGGQDSCYGINEVTMTHPKAASIGEETVLSGSIARSIARGYSFETMFVQVAPEITVAAVAGGAVTAGSYTLQACWKYVDDAGVVHRSSPSLAAKTVVTAAGNLTIQAKIQNLMLHNRENGTIYLELYSTQINPTATSQKYLVATQAQGAGGSTTINITAAVAVALPLYTLNGAILSNLPVPASGGVAVVNRRMWVADNHTIYASKKYKVNVNEGVYFNDDGPLTLSLPTPAGKILALEALDDKLIIFCQNAVFMTQGDGPDDTGLGPDFLFPVKICDFGISNEAGSTETVHGVAYHSIATTTDGGIVLGYNNLYLLDRGLNTTPIGYNIQEEVTALPGDGVTGVMQLGYVADRDLLVAHKNNARKSFFVLDMKTQPAPGQWTVWTSPNGDIDSSVNPGSVLTLAGIGGTLWGVFNPDSDSGSGTSGEFSNTPGVDDVLFVGDTTHNVRMLLKTNQLYANTQDGLGWAKVRSVTILGNQMRSPGSYTEGLTVIQDRNIVTTPFSNTYTQDFTDSVWPANRPAVEYRLPLQKCSQIQFQLTASPAVARWSQLRLDILPSRAKAPAAQRH